MRTRRRREQFFVRALIQPKQAFDFRNEAVEIGSLDWSTAQTEIFPRRHVMRRKRHYAPAPCVRVPPSARTRPVTAVW
jgi:hypothetical protein